jgi:hypothetical protein
MNTRKTMLAFAVAAAFAMPFGASAKDLNFNYIEANYVNVDVDLSESFAEDGLEFALKTDSGGGFQVGGAWELWNSLHLFGEYSEASQDLDATLSFEGETETVSGEFDVVRWRIGVGYAYPMSAEMTVYGRLSFDRIEFKDFKFAGEDIDDEDNGSLSTKDDGLGAEVGLLWAATPEFHLQPYVRYTSVGELDGEKDDSFDADVLFGVHARWFVTNNFAVQGGYEFGEISTWNVGVRFAF